jgi:hypothetical protein
MIPVERKDLVKALDFIRRLNDRARETPACKVGDLCAQILFDMKLPWDVWCALIVRLVNQAMDAKEIS